MAKKKTATEQTSVGMVIDTLKEHYAFTPDTAVRCDASKNLRPSTSVIAYTIANLMETDVIIETDDDQCYFVEKNWNEVVHKVNFACVILLGPPIVILLIFLGIQMLIS